MLPKVVLTLVIVKGLIWSISLGSGTSGGVLAPLLMMGGALGGLEAHVFPDAGIGFWPLVGMGAILGGTMRSPLTGIIFAVELTHDMDMFLPLVIAVTIAHAFTVLTLKRSILTEKVARRGFHVSREYAIDELEILFARDAMTTEVAVLSSTHTVAEALASVSAPGDEKSQHLFPVLDEEANIVGAITYRRLAAAEPTATIHRITDRAPPFMFSNETLRTAVHRMAETGATRLLVVNPSDPRKLVGKIALHDVLKARLGHIEDERRRERVLPFEYLVPSWLPLPQAMRREPR
jgi:CBS domain-containing protein